MAEKRNESLMLGLLLALAGLLYLPFVYRGSTGEADTMRMAIGILKSIANGAPYAGYNADISFGYYRTLQVFGSYFETHREALVPFMNHFSALTAIAFVIPFFSVVKRLWGLSTAVVSCVILMFIPVWWNTGLYGHPMIQAAFLMICGIHALSGAVPADRPEARMRWSALLLSSILFALAMTFRLDIVLMFPLIPAILWMLNLRLTRNLGYTILIGVVTAGLYLLCRMVAGPAGGQVEAGSGAVMASFAEWHNLGRYTGNFVGGTTVAVLALQVVFLALFAAGCVRLAVGGKVGALLFVVPVVLINYVFWLPNPSPARHFLYAAPLLAVGAAHGLDIVLARLKWRTVWLAPGLALLAALVSLGVAEGMYPVVQKRYPWKHGVQDYSYRVPIRSMFINKERSEAAFRNAAAFGERLAAMEARDRPVMAVTDYALASLLRICEVSKPEDAASVETVRYLGGSIFRFANAKNTINFPDTYEGSYERLFAPESGFADDLVVYDPTSSFGAAGAGDGDQSGSGG